MTRTPAAHDLALSFLGGTGTVTGSRYLATWNDHNVLVDCGLFQGYKQLRLRNWARPPFDAASLDAVVLTHAHIDHSGYLPVLANSGFRGRVYATAVTFALEYRERVRLIFRRCRTTPRSVDAGPRCAVACRLSGRRIDI